MNFGHEIRKSFATLRDMLHDRGVDASSLDRVSVDDVVAASTSKNVLYVDIAICAHRVIYDMNA